MSHFTQYLYDPDAPDLVQRIEADIEQFRFACPDKLRLIRYTILTYDPHADLLRLFPTDFLRRKYEAAIRAGFTVSDSGKFEPWVEDCMVGANERYNEALVEYVSRFNVADLPGYVMYREVFFSEMKAALSAPDSKTKKEAVVNAETARNRLTELERKIFTGDEVLEIRSALYVKAEKMKLQLRPENIAGQIEARSLEIADPYYPTRTASVGSAQRRIGRPRKDG